MSRHHRGVAMLMALATVVLVLAGVTAGLAALRGARQSTWVNEVDGRLLAGLIQGERLAVAWMETDADHAVLPPDGGGILLVDDRFVLPSGEGRLSVVAYDGLAGLPACLAQKGSALRLALPLPLMGVAIPPISAAQAERSASLLDSLELPTDVARFPRIRPGRGRVWSTTGSSGRFEDERQEVGGASLAEAIAFRSDGRVNLNTAPAALLRSVYGVLGLGGVEDVLEHRRLLQPSTPPAKAPAAAGGLRLVAQSDRWQMLITVSWLDIHRSWLVDFATAPQSATMLQCHDVRD